MAVYSKALLACTLLLCIVGLAFAYTAEEKQELWKQFQKQHARKYFSDDLHNYRFSVFSDNLDMIEKKNAAVQAEGKSYTYGINKYADMTPGEFKSKMLSDINAFEVLEKKGKTRRLGSNKIQTRRNIPAGFDWREKGAVNRVKDQGMCGSCWAFSAIGNIEGLWYLYNGTMTSLSEQHMVDCDHYCDPEDPMSCDAGCNGGLMSNAFAWAIDNGGIATEDSYRYTARDGKCRTSGYNVGAKISSWTMLPTNETQIAQYLMDNGPLSVALNAEDLSFYSGGIYEPKWCDPEALDHGVTLVGFGTEGNKPYWIAKNSWGANWGDKGYFKILRNSGMCGINAFVCSARV